MEKYSQRSQRRLQPRSKPQVREKPQNSPRLLDKLKNIGDLGDQWRYSWEFGESPKHNPEAYEAWKSGLTPNRLTQWEQNPYPKHWQKSRGPLGWLQRILWESGQESSLGQRDIRDKQQRIEIRDKQQRIRDNSNTVQNVSEED